MEKEHLPDSTMKLSVVIVNYNVCYFLEQCLHSVKKACEGISAEVIVVDNNSKDGSVAMVQEKFPWVTLIANTKNTGFSFANNQAMRISHGEYILLLNPDTLVEEQTFSRIIAFMDAHPEGGGLGVKMIDGKGIFLPESKRGLPTPEVAFYKIFGLSLMFPRSRRFGRYHLGYLDNESIHEIEILSGAFMFMRRSVLEKTGLLDEDFFMYGEDIDLSYRITKVGYKNFYFPDTRIIHYKGESTKKSSINYVFVFYRAMVIFAQKHFSQKNANTFSMLINMAIYMRAGIAIISRFLRRLWLPVVDLLVIYSGFSLLSVFADTGINWLHPLEKGFLPVLMLICFVALVFSGAYDKPMKLMSVVKGLFAGSALSFVLFHLAAIPLPFEPNKIPVALIWALIALVGIRYLLHLLKINGYELDSSENRRFLVVGAKDEGARVARLLEKTSIIPGFIGTVNSEETVYDARYQTGHIGELAQLVKKYRIDEVIFCGANVSSARIIDLMETFSLDQVEFKIAPPGSLYLIGSNSSESSGDLYVIDINSISKPSNKRIKRVIDFSVSIFFFISWPIMAFFIEKPFTFLKNIFSVLLGVNSWVGYARATEDSTEPIKPLPQIKKGILNTSDFESRAVLSSSLLNRLNLLYSKDYSPAYDLAIIRKGFRKLGR
jgi:GT2 family glycosyltransferase